MIGEISEYPMSSLGDLAKKVDYGLTAAAKQSGPALFLRITDIQNGIVDWRSVPRCDCSSEDLRKYALSPGDIVFTRTGATTGKSFLIRDCPENTVFASYLIRVRPKISVDPSYLAHFFNTPYYWAQVNKNSVGAAQGGVNATKLKKIEVPAPTLHEQKRIAAILDKADAIRCKRQQAIALTEDLLRSTFLDSVGPGADGYDRWGRVAVEDLAEPTKGSIRSGPFGSALLHSEFVDSGIAVLGIDNAVKNRFEWAERRFVTTEKYEALQRYRVFPDDVLITIMGTIGRSSVVPADVPTAITTKHLATITVRRDLIEPEFLSHALHLHPVVLQQIGSANRGAIMAGLNLGLIRKIEIPLPPIDAQRRFVNVLGRIRTLEAKLASSLPDDLFASLSQRAFRGEL